jgi:hypothetical protein
MKEQILHLDPHDDFISARDKMGWVQTERVLLVWPPRGRLLNRRLDLVLLHRHAHRLGAHLGLVTAADDIREHAADLGVPVFDSVEASRKMRWRSRVPRLRPERGERRQPPLDPQTFRAAVSVPALTLPAWAEWILKTLFFLIGLSGVFALLYALVPSATITLTPATHVLTATTEIIADSNLTQVEASGFIPARVIRVEVEDSGLAPTTGNKDVPSEPATGAVVFTNIAGTAATIPQGTGVRTTSGTAVRFTTTKAATIEGRISAVVEVPIKAVDPGLAGNVPGGLINAIDGPLGLQLAVINPAATQNGQVTPKAAVVEADRALVRAQLMGKLQQAAGEAVQSQLQPGEFLVADSITITRLIAETYDHSVGEAADTLALTLRLAASGLVVDENDARLAAQSALQAQVPSTETLLDHETQFTRDPLTTLDADGRAHFIVTATGPAVPRIDRETVQRLAQGQTLPDAGSTLFANLQLAQPPRITIHPAWYAQWFARLPIMLFRIQVVVASQ